MGPLFTYSDVCLCEVSSDCAFPRPVEVSNFEKDIRNDVQFALSKVGLGIKCLPARKSSSLGASPLMDAIATAIAGCSWSCFSSCATRCHSSQVHEQICKKNPFLQYMQFYSCKDIILARIRSDLEVGTAHEGLGSRINLRAKVPPLRPSSSGSSDVDLSPNEAPARHACPATETRRRLCTTAALHRKHEASKE